MSHIFKRESLLAIPLMLSAFGSSRLWAQSDGGTPGSALRFGIGARALGLAGAYAGIADDATAIYWNPGGLSALIKPELSATHVTLAESTSHDFVGYAAPLKKYGVIGAALIRASSGGFQKRRTPFDAPVPFSVAQNAYMVAFGRKFSGYDFIPGSFALGASLKKVEESVDTAKASGLGADIGVLYRPVESVSIGVVVQNALAPSLTFLSSPVTYTRVYDVSPAYTRSLSQDFKLTMAVRGNYFEGALHPAGGVELQYAGGLRARLGIQAKGLSTGVGMTYRNYQIDYAIQLHQVAANHVVSLRMKFGKTKEELEADIRRGMRSLDENEAKRMAQNYYQQALNFRKEDNLTGAVSSLENAALWDPKNEQFSRKLEEAKTELTQRIGRQVAEASVVQARQQYEQGNLLASMEYWKAVLALDAKHAEALAFIKKINSRLGAQEKLRMAQAQAEIIDVQVARFTARARGLQEQGFFSEAVAEVQRAIKLEPRNRGALALLQQIDASIRQEAKKLIAAAEQAAEQKDYPRAVSAYQAVLKLFPGAAKIKERLAQAQAELSSGVKPEIKKEAERLYFSAVDQYLKKDYQATRQTLGRVFELDPYNEGAKKLKIKLDAASQ